MEIRDYNGTPDQIYRNSIVGHFIQRDQYNSKEEGKRFKVNTSANC